MTTICAPASASPVNISFAAPFGREPKASTITRTSTPSASFRSSRSAISVPTWPSRQPNMRMCTDDRAALHVGEDPREEALPLDPRLDRRGGRPGEVESASCGRGESRAANASVAASHPPKSRRPPGRPARALRDPEHLPEDEDEEERQHEEGDCHRCPRPTTGGVRVDRGGPGRGGAKPPGRRRPLPAPRTQRARAAGRRRRGRPGRGWRRASSRSPSSRSRARRRARRPRPPRSRAPSTSPTGRPAPPGGRTASRCSAPRSR